MIQRTIQEITSMIDVLNDVSNYNDHIIKGVAFDTRRMEKGNLFVPLQGEKADGHQFVHHAIQNGAAAVLWQKDIPNPPEEVPVLMVEDTLKALQDLALNYRNQLAVKVVGITGSNGKTTTKDIAASVFGEKFRVHKTEGNFNNHIGLPITILSMKEDTEVAILEMGMSERGEISLLSKIARPDVAIITNIGEAHLQDLGSREEIAKAKLEIIDGLNQNGVLIYPGNEPLLTTLVKDISPIRHRTFGDSQKFDIYPADIHIYEGKSEFIVPTLSDSRLSLPIMGKHNVFNALSVILAALEFDIPFSAIQQGLEKVELSNMRMEWIDGIKNTKILNDAYNASPTSMRAVLSMFMEIDKEKIVVLGDMLELGKDEEAYHREIGEELDPNKIKYVFTYGPLATHIGEGAKKHFEETRVFSYLNKDELVQDLLQKIDGEEWILFKASRGMKLEEIIDHVRK